MRPEIPFLAVLLVAVFFGVLIVLSLQSQTAAMPDCHEDEYAARRPFPEGEPVCIHQDVIAEQVVR